MVAPSTRLPGTSVSPVARAVMSGVLRGVPAASHGAVRGLFAQAAGADGNRHLSGAEAALVRDVFEAHRGEHGVDLAAAQGSVIASLERLTAERDPDGIKSYFTSTNPDVGQVVLDEMIDVVARAKGKPVELDIMIFAFTDRRIADGMLDLVANNPNLTIRMIADWSQIPSTGGRQPARIAREAERRGISDRLFVKFKKDDPYVWNEAKGGPAYSHASTEGLNHHKGFVARIDGVPVKLVTGSFNWSKTAANSNYENLFVVSDDNRVNRDLQAAYHAEFLAFFNHPDTVNLEQADAYRRDLYNALAVANGRAPSPVAAPGAPTPLYVPRAPGEGTDVNDLGDESYAKLTRLLGSASAARSVAYHVATYGRVASFDELAERVSAVRRLPEAKKQVLADVLRFGDASVPINSASAAELVRALKLKPRVAAQIVAHRNRVGDFESAEELRGLPGMTDSILERIADRVNDDSARAFFSAKPIAAGRARTGWADVNANRRVPVMGLDGVVTQEEARLAAGVVDLLRRARPGDTAKIAMYGMSTSVESFDAIVDAARRGVAQRVLLHKSYNGGAITELKRLAAQEGLPIEVRVPRRTMHEKFGVVNDDCFHGSANMSGSSTSKHSEDRFVVKNNPHLAGDLDAEFDRIWDVSRPG